ncbi:hypothetical protein G6F46_007597 [Rhizopus delemar]|uniref:Uncharacterized protein n=3 Tax=Rhizopus TaxID=4842 RepID=I1C0R4_RHIO9|nr:hypothetical protein RO3G_06749 [Rhizopus delemar RA 99-880]KAG1049654.1 hypothetical protein G6F43_008034 [Rhizopus delemar]KAG1541518.1 hypothetical protein G6F51_007841 [Rhizopus arrhizus]KAG1456574.1 hypothetical protein G6F55_006435 [Rhizopus delemar]KAG1495637.1 hypothetical protein G6F54_007036 [Rhizopus delemar]|eukprot:EIE82044.1 hypothetical protein RO3G_06749 [Rhizopus delemar RA 99-880]
MLDFTRISNSNIKRSKKPKPLFGIFRTKTSEVKNPEPTYLPTQTLSSKPLTLGIRQFSQPKRPRSKSDGNSTNRLFNEREMALKKLCQKELQHNPQSLVDSLPLLISPTFHLPAVPPVPINYRKPNIRKISSAHDLQKAKKLHQASIYQSSSPPLPEISRSKSLSNIHQRKKVLKHLNTATVATFSRQDDDDVPLVFLQSLASKSSSLLNDSGEDDDMDLIPIAKLNHLLSNTQELYLTAADKYKEKVRERLLLDDDNIPISQNFSRRHK